MIIEKSIGDDIAPDTETATSLMSVFSSPTNWNATSNRLKMDISIFGDPLPIEVAGYYVANFSLDINGDTVPTNIVAAWMQLLKVEGDLRSDTAANADFTVRITGFALYNVFEYSTLDFATLDSWVGNDNMPNDKFSAMDFSASTSVIQANRIFSVEGGPFDVSTLNNSYTSQIGLEGVTALGFMCETVSATNTESITDFAFNISSSGVARPFQYLPQLVPP